MKRSKPPNKEIEEAILYAEENGLVYKYSGQSSHAWEDCFTHYIQQMPIWSTPRSSFNHAQQIRRLVDKCQHSVEEENK